MGKRDGASRNHRRVLCDCEAVAIRAAAGSSEGKAHMRAHSNPSNCPGLPEPQARSRNSHAQDRVYPNAMRHGQEARGLFLPLRSMGTSGASQSPNINIRSLLGAQTWVTAKLKRAPWPHAPGAKSG